MLLRLLVVLEKYAAALLFLRSTQRHCVLSQEVTPCPFSAQKGQELYYSESGSLNKKNRSIDVYILPLSRCNPGNRNVHSLLASPILANHATIPAIAIMDLETALSFKSILATRQQVPKS